MKQLKTGWYWCKIKVTETLVSSKVYALEYYEPADRDGEPGAWYYGDEPFKEYSIIVLSDRLEPPQ
jgi:hypothetical protein